MYNIRAYELKIKCDHFVFTDFCWPLLLVIAFFGFWEFWFFSAGLSALELGVDLACLDLRGSRDFLPFGSGPSKIIVLESIWKLEIVHLRTIRQKSHMIWRLR